MFKLLKYNIVNLLAASAVICCVLAICVGASKQLPPVRSGVAPVKFIKLTCNDKFRTPFYVNPTHIRKISDEEGFTAVSYTDKTYSQCLERAHQVARIINNAPNF